MNYELQLWIDNASYEDLLRKWRFAPAGDPLFQLLTGKYYWLVMEQRKQELPPGQAAAISKKLGW